MWPRLMGWSYGINLAICRMRRFTKGAGHEDAIQDACDRQNLQTTRPV